MSDERSPLAKGDGAAVGPTSQQTRATSTRPPPVELDDILLQPSEDEPLIATPPASDPADDEKTQVGEARDTREAREAHAGERERRPSDRSRAAREAKEKAREEKRNRPRMTLRIPDDQVARPNLPPNAPPSEPNVRVGADLQAKIAARAAGVPEGQRIVTLEPPSPDPPSVIDADSTVRMPAMRSGMLPDLDEDSWTPHMPLGVQRDAAKRGDREASDTPPSSEIPIETEEPVSEATASAAKAEVSPGPITPVMVADARAVPPMREERATDPNDGPRSLELGADDILTVDSSPRAQATAAQPVGSNPPPAPPMRARAPSVPPPPPPTAVATSPNALPTGAPVVGVPPMRPKVQSVPPPPPPPAPPIATPSTPSPPPAQVQLTGDRLSAPGAGMGTGAAVGGALAPPAMNDSVAHRKRTRPWWEELFNDDFLRASEKLTDRQISREVDFIEDSLGVVKGAMVLDLACGTGRHAIDLTRRGYQVVGYDLSLSMLARAADEAEDRGISLNFVQGDMRDMTFEETFDGVYSWNTSFGYFEEDKNAQVISKVHRALKKGGQFLLDVANRDFIGEQSPSLVWFEGEGCICMDEMHVDWITSRMRVKRTMMMDDGRSKEIEYSIRIYALHELGRLLHDHGFRVAEVSGRTATPGVFFGSHSPRVLILAEKR